MGRQTFKILSYNIHKGFSVGNVRFLLDSIRRAIRLVDADIVFLQEVCGFREVPGHTDVDLEGDADLSGSPLSESAPLSYQFEYLADTIWRHNAYGRNAIYDRGHHGNAVLSKAPFVTWENVDISVLGFSQRGFLYGIVDLGAFVGQIDVGRLHVLCVHLGLLEAERRRQIAQIREWVDKKIPAGEPLIFAGDFNDWRRAGHRQILKTMHLKEGYWEVHGRLARTFPVWAPTFRLDRVYHRGLRPTGAEVLTGAPWNRLSDHAPLYLEFEFCGSSSPQTLRTSFC